MSEDSEYSFDESNEFYTEEEIELQLEDDDVINGAEQGFMAGYIGASKAVSL